MSPRRLWRELKRAWGLRSGPDGWRPVPVPHYMAARADGDLETETRFLQALQLRNRVSKRTHQHRLDDTIDLLVAHSPTIGATELRVLDVGCSSGISTLELDEGFRRSGLDVETCGLDIATRACYVQRSDGRGLLFDPLGNVLQTDLGDWSSSWRWKYRDLLWNPVRMASALSLAWGSSGRFLSARAGEQEGFAVSEIPLVNPRVAEASPRVRIVEGDLLSLEIGGSFHVIRAANVLNRGFFHPSRLRAIVRALRELLIEGGLFLVVRTLDMPGAPAVNEGTLFRRERDGFRRLRDLNGGSEIASLVLEPVSC